MCFISIRFFLWLQQSKATKAMAGQRAAEKMVKRGDCKTEREREKKRKKERETKSNNDNN